MQEGGWVGGWFYPCIISMNIALVFAIVGAILR
jgi:hypothetical protein